jgi:hypothetical protein
LIEEYQRPLREAVAREPDQWVLTQETIKSLFYQIEVISRFTETLLAKLETRVDSWNEESILGDIFVEMGDYLKVYRSYINNYATANEIYRNLIKQDKKFTEFLAGVSQKLAEKKQFFGYDLDSFLITPVQRIPRYIILLKSLLNYTAKTHKDYPLIQDAITKISQVASSNEKSHATSININKVLEVQRLFPTQHIVEPKRKYVLEGEVRVYKMKAGKIQNRNKRYYLFLFNDIIIFAKIVRDKKTSRRERNTVVDKNNFNITNNNTNNLAGNNNNNNSPAATTPTCLLSLGLNEQLQYAFQSELSGVQVSDYTDDTVVPNAFLFTHFTGYSLCIATAAPTEKQKWLDALTNSNTSSST